MPRDDWLSLLNDDPRPWLLDESTPAVRAAALQRLLGRSATDPEVVEARSQAMRADPIRSILEAQDPAGWWVKPGPGYSPKYRGTVWNLMFLEQLGADPDHPGVRAAIDYVLRICPTSVGGFGCSGSHKEAPPPPSAVLHCLNGNLLRPIIGFGYLDDPRVRAAIEWEVRAITGDGMDRWYPSRTSGPGFACGVNEELPCGWGAVKALRGLAAIPPARRSAAVVAAIETGVEFVFSRDPAVADYPMGYGNTEPSKLWFKPGFPSGYHADVLQILEVLGELGRGSDQRLASGPGVAPRPPGRPGALDQPVRLQPEDHCGLRTSGQTIQVGDAAGVLGAGCGLTASGPFHPHRSPPERLASPLPLRGHLPVAVTAPIRSDRDPRQAVEREVGRRYSPGKRERTLSGRGASHSVLPRDGEMGSAGQAEAREGQLTREQRANESIRCPPPPPLRSLAARTEGEQQETFLDPI